MYEELVVGDRVGGGVRMAVGVTVDAGHTLMSLQAAAVFAGVEPLRTTSLSLFTGNGRLERELLHGLAHERGEIGRLPGRDQIGVNNHLPVLIERAGPFQLISHRLVTGGASPLHKAGAD